MTTWKYGGPPTHEEVEDDDLCVVADYAAYHYILTGKQARFRWRGEHMVRWHGLDKYRPEEDRYVAEEFTEDRNGTWVVYDRQKGVIRVDRLTQYQAVRIAQVLNEKE